MECNRDEALRAREIAEQKLASQDYHGALKFLQKALQLFPALENTSQLSAVLDVHIAAQVKVNGTEMDWYGILQVDPSAEETLIKKQYKKLALLLHPDKNKLAGAEAAFKLIGEALQVLSDKAQRAVYDSRRKYGSKVSSTSNRTHSRQAATNPYVNRPAAAPETFITMCPSCHTRFQYYRVYANQNLLCHQCRVPFLAREYYAGVNNGAWNNYGWQNFSQPQQGYAPSSHQTFPYGASFASGVNAHGSYNVNPTQGFASRNGVPSAEFTSQMFKEKNQVEEVAQRMKRKWNDDKEQQQQKKEKADQRCEEGLDKEILKRKRQAEKASAKDKKRRSRKRSSDSSDEDDDDDDDESESLSDDQVLNDVGAFKDAPRRSSRQRRNVSYKLDVSDDDYDRGSPKERQVAQAPKEHFKTSKEAQQGGYRKENDVHNGESLEKQKLADLSKWKIRVNLKNLQAAKSSAVTEVHNGPAKTSTTKREEGGGVSEACKEDGPAHTQQESRGKKDVKPESVPEVGSIEEAQEKSENEGDEEEKPEEYSVPDPDFHNFDKDREEKDVKAGQVWASYDNVDGLPRFYFKVKAVQSKNPFKVSISWLELRNLSDEQKALKKLGFFPACGNGFRYTSSQVLDSMGMFSHILKWEKGPKGSIRIVPRKGDIWALFSDWKPGVIPKRKDALQKYDMVEVVTDFNDQTGVVVSHLERLPEFKTVFRCLESPVEIPAAELCRFSYQVPAYKLLGHEGPGSLAGCWELDPASVPLNVIFPGSSGKKSS